MEFGNEQWKVEAEKALFFTHFKLCLTVERNGVKWFKTGKKHEVAQEHFMILVETWNRKGLFIMNYQILQDYF
jgi:hypothetical protein